jgi:heme oxygenase
VQKNTESVKAGSYPAIGSQLRQQESSVLAMHLRAATRSAHHLIDHHVQLAPLVRTDLQRDHYIKLLQTFARIYQGLDSAFTEALQRFCPDTEFRPSDRSGWLAQDLRYFGAHGNFTTPCWQWPKIDAVAELVGRLYTIEGSTLGGQVIARQLEQSIGVGPESGGRMFHGHGQSTYAHWQAFIEFADRECPVADTDAACAAANRMFVELSHHMETCFECSERV